MTGKDSIYVPGWDCHGLPIEWKIEEEYTEKKEKIKMIFQSCNLEKNAGNLRKNGLTFKKKNSEDWA